MNSTSSSSKPRVSGKQKYTWEWLDAIRNQLVIVKLTERDASERDDAEDDVD